LGPFCTHFILTEASENIHAGDRTVYRCPELLAGNGLRPAGRGFPCLTINLDLVNQIDVAGNDVCSPGDARFFEPPLKIT
jgi:hypothetical protein